jgi:hypothetical protein
VFIALLLGDFQKEYKLLKMLSINERHKNNGKKEEEEIRYT